MNVFPLVSALGVVLIGVTQIAQAQLVSRPKPEMVLQTGGTSNINSLAFSPNGRWLASGNQDKSIRIWDVSSGQELRTFVGQIGVNTSVSFSPDGKLLASSSADGATWIWEAETGRRVQTLGGKGWPRSYFSRDGESLVVLYQDSAKTWEVATGKELQNFSLCAQGDSSRKQGVSDFMGAADSDSKLLVAGCGGPAPRIETWDLVTGRFVRSTPLQNRWPNALRLSPDGQRLVLVTVGNGTSTTKAVPQISIWDLAAGIELKTTAIGSAIHSLALSLDGRWAATGGSDHAVRLWDTFAEGARILGRHAGSVFSVALSHDGQRVASGGGDRTVKLWNIATGREERSLVPIISHIAAVSFASDGRSLWFSSGGVCPTCGPGVPNRAARIRLFQLEAAKLTDVARPEPPSAYSTNAVASVIPEIQRGRARSQRLGVSPPPLVFGTSANMGAAIGPGWRLGAVGFEKSAKVWDLVSFREALSLDIKQGSLLSTAFSSDGERLAVGDSTGAIEISEISTKRRIASLSSSRGAVLSVVFSPDGRYLGAGNGDNTLTVWEIEYGREVRTLSTPGFGGASAVAFSSDGRLLAMGSGDNNIRLWDLTGEGEGRTLSGHTGRVSALGFSPTGKWLASGSNDGSLRIWDLARAEQLVAFAFTDEGNDWVAVTPDGLFDGSEKGAQNLVSWRIGNRLYPADRFFADFYVPSLVFRVLSGERPKPFVDLASLKLPPEVRIVSPVPGTVKRAGTTVDVETQDQGGGMSELRLYHNGKLVASDTTGRVGRRRFEIRLVPGDNVLKAVALSAEGVESNDDSVALHYDGPAGGKPTLHLLVVAINRYTDSSFNLGYARQDGEAIASFFEKRGAPLFGTVKVRRMFDGEATRANIRKNLALLAEEADAEDVVIVYFAGHGITVGQQFYFLPHEMRKEQDERAAIGKYGIPIWTLGNDLRLVPALKQVLILDVCQGEAALKIIAKQVGFRSLGTTEEKAARILSRANGIHLLAASTKQQYAMELPELGHGLLTYALLQGLGEKGPPAALDQGQKMVTVSSLLSYVEQLVPELAEKYQQGNKQEPTVTTFGQNFPLLVVH